MARHARQSGGYPGVILRHPMCAEREAAGGEWYYPLPPECPGPDAPPGCDPCLWDFKRMHFCERHMADLLRRYGGEAVFRSDYVFMAELRQEMCDRIALSSLDLVYSLYKYRTVDDGDSEELLNDGLRALAKAIDTFDPDRGVQFSSYACSLVIRAFYRRMRGASRQLPQESVEEGYSRRRTSA
jgi:hypothetical protein